MEADLVKLKFMLNDKSEVIKQDTVTFLTQWKNYLAVVSTRVDTTQEQVSVTKFSQSQRHTGALTCSSFYFGCFLGAKKRASLFAAGFLDFRQQRQGFTEQLEDFLFCLDPQRI